MCLFLAIHSPSTEQTMEVQSRAKAFTKNKSFSHLAILISIGLFSLFLILILFHAQASPFGFTSLSTSSASWEFFKTWRGTEMDANLSLKLQDSVTFLPLKDIRFAKTAVERNTWFMSSEWHIWRKRIPLSLFPLISIQGKAAGAPQKEWQKRCTKNSYALAWPEGLPNSTTLLKGLTFVSDTFYDYKNLWHGLTAMFPFVGWSMKNGCQGWYFSTGESSETKWDCGFRMLCKQVLGRCQLKYLKKEMMGLIVLRRQLWWGTMLGKWGTRGSFRSLTCWDVKQENFVA